MGGRLALTVAGLMVVVAVGGLGVRRALEARGEAQRTIDASSRATEAASRAAEVASRGGPALEGEAAEPPRPQGGFGDGMKRVPVDLTRGETLAPREAKVEGGERVAPFHGFGVSVESAPAGARVRANGEEVGETPIVSSVRCAPGEEVEVRVEKAGFRPWRRAVRCRADALVSLEAKLAR